MAHQMVHQRENGQKEENEENEESEDQTPN
jgi:hypothetical protein